MTDVGPAARMHQTTHPVFSLLEVRLLLGGFCEVAPGRAAEIGLAERHVAQDVVLVENPRETQDRVRHAVLDAVLLDERVLEHLAQSIVTGISAQPHVLADGDGVRVEVDPLGGVARGEDELLELFAFSARIEQVKRSADAHLDERFAVLLLRREVTDRVHPFDRFGDEGFVAHGAFDDFNTVELQGRAELCGPHVVSGLEKRRDEVPSDLPAAPADKHLPDSLRHRPLLGVWGLSLFTGGAKRRGRTGPLVARPGPVNAPQGGVTTREFGAPRLFQQPHCPLCANHGDSPHSTASLRAARKWGQSPRHP
ncbi:MAG: hypothetical protein AMK75_05215 [Planctomycetes bacterium SM23_65]|nr:MAG: hypothetical protein AMK75_05215 [Planctomycetes bacterium SM23_65]